MKGRRPFTDTECRKILTELGRGRFGLRNQAIFWVGITTGFRISEILSLRLADVMAGDDVLADITIKRATTKGKRHGGSAPTNPRTAKALKRWVDQLKSIKRLRRTDFVFQAQNSSRPISREHYWGILDGACQRAKVYGSTGTHSMRKTFAKWYYSSTKDIVKTKNRMRHAELSSTMSYMGFDEAEDRKIISRFGQW